MLPKERICVSNIAWPKSDHLEGLRLLSELDVGSVEIAPGQVFSGWDDLAGPAKQLRRDAESMGLSIPAMQGWLFGVEGASLFESAGSRDALATHMTKVAKLAGLLGAGACVYGAPRTRDPGDLPAAAARDIAIEFFRKIGPVFAAENSAIMFEANAARYGCKFITTTAEAIEFVDAVNSPGVKLQIDLGTIVLGNEPTTVFRPAVPRAGHVHISEMDLAPIGTTGLDHPAFGRALKEAGWRGIISIEMRAVTDWRERVAAAVSLVKSSYG